jgi:hypothetical protein
VSRRRRWLPPMPMAMAALGLALVSVGRAAPASADGPSIDAYAYRAHLLRAGESVSVFVSVGSVDPNLTVTIDGVGLLTDGFVQRMTPSGLYFCPDGSGCYPCPVAHSCFSTGLILTIDVRAQGHRELPITVTEGNGRVTRTSLPLDIRPAADRDADGMPDWWESRYQLSDAYGSQGTGPGDDPDGDGRTNLEEFRRGTNPRATHTTWFAEASSGDRGQGIEQCFRLTSLAAHNPGYDSYSGWVTLIGDDGRRSEPSGPFGCPMWRVYHPGERVVAAIVESTAPVLAERIAVSGTRVYPPTTPATPTAISSTGVPAPSTRWLFADGGTDGVADAFYLFFNPGARPLDVTMTYRRDDGRLLLRRVRTVGPGARLTVWVNADEPSLGRVPAFTEITASAPVLVERAWRFDPQGRTVTQASASPGSAAPAPRWIFPDVDGRDRTEAAVVVANPSGRAAIVDVTLLYEQQDERRIGALSIPAGGRVAIPARQLEGLAGTRASVEVASRSDVGLVAERTIVGHDAEGPWRLASAGATLAGIEWALPTAEHSSDLVITNVSTAPATIQLRFATTAEFESDVVKTVVVPARRRLVYPLGGTPTDPQFPFRPGRVTVTSQAAAGPPADVVVELVRRGKDFGASRDRAAGLIAGRIR